MLNGGGNSLLFYQVKKVAGTWTVVQAGTETAAAGTGDALQKLTKIEQSQLQPQDSGVMNITLDQYQDNQAFTTFLKNYAWKQGAVASLPQVIFEDGVVEGGAGADGMLLAISHGPVNPDDGLRKIHCAVGSIAKSSGGSTQKNGEYIKPSVSFVGQTIDGDMSIVKELFDAALVDIATATNQTLDSGLGFDIFWLPKFTA